MKIDEIKTCKKGLLCVVVDGKEYLINSDTVALAGLKKGSSLSQQELNQLVEDSDCDRAKSRALWYLSRADSSKKTLFDKLCRSYPPKAAESAVARMEELGLIDDCRYARNLAQALSEANVSDREILRKLFVKGVPSDIAKQAVEELCSDGKEQIKALLSRKYAQRLKSEDGVRKVFNALLRKGFSYADVRSALKNYSQEIEFSEEL